MLEQPKNASSRPEQVNPTYSGSGTRGRFVELIPASGWSCTGERLSSPWRGKNKRFPFTGPLASTQRPSLWSSKKILSLAKNNLILDLKIRREDLIQTSVSMIELRLPEIMSCLISVTRPCWVAVHYLWVMQSLFSKHSCLQFRVWVFFKVSDTKSYSNSSKANVWMPCSVTANCTSKSWCGNSFWPNGFTENTLMCFWRI